MSTFGHKQTATSINMKSRWPNIINHKNILTYLLYVLILHQRLKIHVLVNRTPVDGSPLVPYFIHTKYLLSGARNLIYLVPRLIISCPTYYLAPRLIISCPTHYMSPEIEFIWCLTYYLAPRLIISHKIPRIMRGGGI